MKQSIVISATFFAILLLAGGQCKKEEVQKPDYFNCEYYSYLPNEGFPVLTPEDSTATAEFLVKSGIYTKRFLELDYSGTFIFHYLPYIKNGIDTALFNRFLITGEAIDKFKPIYKSLNWFEISILIMSDALFIGTVTEKIYVRDSTKCLLYGIKNVYRVEEVLYSRFPLKKGNYLLESRFGGYSGGCTPSGEEEIFTSVTHEEDYNVGSKQLFRANRQDYARIFIGQGFLRGKYNDEYCPNIFSMVTNSNSWNTEKIKDMKQFYKENLKQSP
ncbi:MAG: hypothetical protein IPM47_21415 [Sphingobacteriales bacterium]|nr:MAG: hypothetical protein IPM47_21415 [Sphingobacteriales bacterium]